MLLTLAHLFTPAHTNNHRPKVIHPSGLALLVGIFLTVQSGLQLWKMSAVTLPGGLVLGYASSITPSQVIGDTNGQREAAGLAPLTANDQLTAAALAKANYMFAHDFWAHVAPDGTTPWVFIHNAGYTYTVAGENLARDFSDEPSMMSAWMNSPTHRENIMNPKFHDIGIAVVDGKLQGVETTLVVQMFGSRGVLTARTTSQGAATKTAAAPTTQPVAAATPVPATEPTPVPAVAAAENTLPVNSLTPVEPGALGLSFNSAQGGSQPVTLISPLTVTKAIASSIVVMLIGVLAYDTWVVTHKKLPRSVGKNWGHLAIFSLVIVVIYALTSGRIL